MENDTKALMICLQRVVDDPESTNDQKLHARALLDSYNADPPEGPPE